MNRDAASAGHLSQVEDLSPRLEGVVQSYEKRKKGYEKRKKGMERLLGRYEEQVGFRFVLTCFTFWPRGGGGGRGLLCLARYACILAVLVEGV